MSGHGRAVPLVLVGLVVLMPAGAEKASSQPAAGAPEQLHEVRRGDTLSGIARRHGVTVAALVAANGLPGQNALLRVGQRLVIPLRGTEARLASRPPQALQATRRLVVLRAPGNLILAVPDFGDLLPHFSWPLEGHISSPFGRRRSGWHRGIDIKAGRGVPIVAAAGGVVVVSGVERRYGRVVKIEHPFGFISVYAHNDQNNVEVGERVWAGQTIGLVGRTGRATAHHLHFEIRHGGLVYNPLYMLPLPPRVVVDESLDEEPDEPDE